MSKSKGQSWPVEQTQQTVHAQAGDCGEGAWLSEQGRHTARVRGESDTQLPLQVEWPAAQ